MNRTLVDNLRFFAPYFQMEPSTMGLTAAVIALGTSAMYISTIPRNVVPKNPFLYQVAQMTCMCMAVAAVLLQLSRDALAVYVPAMLAVAVAGSFMWLMSQRKLPKGDLQVKVGDKVLPFKSMTSDYAGWTTAHDMIGKRTLFKFFRGGWCPYCAAEFKAWETMLPELQKHGIQLVGLSKDTVAESAVHKARDNLTMTLLSDPDLTVIKQYGVEHHKALNFATSKSAVFGIPLPISMIPNYKTMAIPTSLLVDEKGDVVWIDQADDYRVRSNNDRVRKELSRAFGIHFPEEEAKKQEKQENESKKQSHTRKLTPVPEVAA